MSKIKKIKRWGNSLTVLLPKTFLDSLSIKEGDNVSVGIVENSIVIKPVREKYHFEELVSQINSDNIHESW